MLCHWLVVMPGLRGQHGESDLRIPSDLDEANLKRWQVLAQPVWKDYADKNENCAKLLALAQKLL